MPLLEADLTSGQLCLQLLGAAFLAELAGSVSYQQRGCVSAPRSAFCKVSRGGLMWQ